MGSKRADRRECNPNFNRKDDKHNEQSKYKEDQTGVQTPSPHALQCERSERERQ